MWWLFSVLFTASAAEPSGSLEIITYDTDTWAMSLWRRAVARAERQWQRAMRRADEPLPPPEPSLPDGLPIAGVTVVISMAGQPKRSCTTDTEGRCRFDGLSAGAWEVFLDREGFLPILLDDVAVQPGQVASQVLRMEAAPGEDIIVTSNDRAPALIPWRSAGAARG